MRLILAIIIAAVAVTAASAGDITLSLNDSSQLAVLNSPAVLDQCVAGVQLRSDIRSCQALARFVAALAAMVRQSQQIARAEDKEKQKTGTPKVTHTEPKAP